MPLYIHRYCSDNQIFATNIIEIPVILATNHKFDIIKKSPDNSHFGGCTQITFSAQDTEGKISKGIEIIITPCY